MNTDITPPGGFDPFFEDPTPVDLPAPIPIGGGSGGFPGPVDPSTPQAPASTGEQNGAPQQQESPVAGEAAGALAPIAHSDSYQTTEGEALDVTAEDGLLANDTGDAIVVEYVEQPDNGAVSLEQDGSFRYEPADGYTGVDTFEYQVLAADGQLSELVTVSIQVEPIPAPAVAAADPGVFAGMALGFAALAAVITAGTLVLRHRTRRLAAA